MCLPSFATHLFLQLLPVCVSARLYFEIPINRTAAADHALQPMMASTYRVRQFIREHKLMSRPRVHMSACGYPKPT